MDALLPVLLATAAVFAIGMLGLAVGVMFSGRCLRGSCGGEQARAADGTPIGCGNCPNKKSRAEA